MEAPREPSPPPGGPARAAAPDPTRHFGIGSSSDLLGAWSYYFVAKLVLAWRDLIGLHLIENLALAAALAWPLASPKWRRARHWAGAPVAAALLYYESWLPSVSRVVSQADLLASFRADYLAELAGRFVSVPVVATLAAVLALCFAAARFVRIDALVVAALLATTLLHAPAGAAASLGPDAFLAAFHAKEAKRFVAFPEPPAGSPPFDLILVHVCSLSWDDLEATGLAQHPLLKGFDVVLRRFNSVSTYSGPSVIRILRAGCGQSPHRDLYSPAPEGCYLMPGLARAGFETQLVLDHDGHFDDFLEFVKAQRVTGAPLPLDGLPAPQRSFDGSKVYDGLAVLTRWLEARQKSPAPRVAAFYNTVSLHDGNRLASDPARSSLETYPKRLAGLLDGLQAFLGQLERSGRRAVVFVVPEHGAALRGDAMQFAGLREIPSPAITLVPVGMKVIGPGARRVGEPLHVDEPTSYLAISHLIARTIAAPPHGEGGFRPADYAAGLPATEFVSESETATLVRRGGKYLLRLEREPWRDYRGSPAP